MPQFAVVIPLYNKEQSFAATLQSVLDQTFSDFELIIVNDGSTDNSLKIVESINDVRIRIINKENGGVSSARNAGIESANGKYIALLDGDDFWLPDYLYEMNQLINKFPDCNIFSANYFISEKSKMQKNIKSDILIVKDNYFELAMDFPLITSSSVVISKDCFDNEIKFNVNLTHGEDLDLWARLYKKYRYIVFLQKRLVKYNHNAENRASNNIPKAKKHFAYHIDLSKAESASEKKYYLNQIANLVWMYCKYPGFKDLLLVLLKFRKYLITIFVCITKNLFLKKFKKVINF